MSIVYTRYIQVYSIRGKSCICTPEYDVHTIQFVVVTLIAIKSSCTLGNTFANTDINGFRSPDRHCFPKIEELLVGAICGTLPRLPMNAYIRKNYIAASSSGCLFI